ncbi:hypothetical protein BS47DRAFT_1357717 [Hydnum rufescens UP504]|uniref:Uncharacterized protein n=1 Tax=Hydnum rufescens UP504 TaxID=1448309 RepID=A0A9P6B9I1_9AGAM|nr:hypothetical protein BS47DRAFT_1357717 [Hydnum rufescens UP504]
MPSISLKVLIIYLYDVGTAPNRVLFRAWKVPVLSSISTSRHLKQAQHGATPLLRWLLFPSTKPHPKNAQTSSMAKYGSTRSHKISQVSTTYTMTVPHTRFGGFFLSPLKAMPDQSETWPAVKYGIWHHTPTSVDPFPKRKPAQQGHGPAPSVIFDAQLPKPGVPSP